MKLIVRDGNAKARPEHFQFVFVQFLLLVRDVLAFAGFTEAVTLDRLREDDCGRAGVIDGSAVSGVDLDRVMSAKPHARRLLIRQVLNHLEKSWMTAKQVLAGVSAGCHETFS